MITTYNSIEYLFSFEFMIIIMVKEKQNTGEFKNTFKEAICHICQVLALI